MAAPTSIKNRSNTAPEGNTAIASVASVSAHASSSLEIRGVTVLKGEEFLGRKTSWWFETREPQVEVHYKEYESFLFYQAHPESAFAQEKIREWKEQEVGARQSAIAEWSEGSAIAQSLIDLNFQWVDADTEHEVLTALCWAIDNQGRNGNGGIKPSILQRYSDLGPGTFFDSLDPTTGWYKEMEWRRFKPFFKNERRQIARETGEIVNTSSQKYLSPQGTSARIYYPRVSSGISAKILGEDSTDSWGEDRDFWNKVAQRPDIPVTVTEGEKKALCLLSQGICAVSIPGIYMGVRGGKDRNRNKDRMLHPDLLPIMEGRSLVYILFDRDKKIATRLNVNKASERLAKALMENGVKEVQIAQVPVVLGLGKESPKGIDDYVALKPVADREASLAKIYEEAFSFEDWQKNFFVFVPQPFLRDYYAKDLNVQYVGESSELALPELWRLRSEFEKGVDSAFPRAIAVKSEMGTGKTQWFQQWLEQNKSARVLAVGHRVSLLRSCASRLGVAFYQDAKGHDLGEIGQLAITADSLFRLGRVIDADSWVNWQHVKAYDVLFLDEIQQLLAHLILGNTCSKRRHILIDIFKFLLKNARLIICCDAHLDDASLRFVEGVLHEDRGSQNRLTLRHPETYETIEVGTRLQVFENNFKSQPRQITNHIAPNSAAIARAITAELIQGRRVFVASDSKAFVKRMERASLGLVLPTGVEGETRQIKIKCLHADNIGETENKGFLSDINENLRQGEYDLFLYSPTLGTGVDINLPGLFDVGAGVFHATNMSASECAQMMFRYRESVPIHLWCNGHPLFGYRHSTQKALTKQQEELPLAVDYQIQKLFLERGYTPEEAAEEVRKSQGRFDAVLFRAKCEFLARKHYSVNNLREDLAHLLTEKGHEVIDIKSPQDMLFLDQRSRMKQAREALKEEYIAGVCAAQELTDAQYKVFLNKDGLTQEERYAVTKHRIKTYYGLDYTTEPEAFEEIVGRDDEGRWQRKLANLVPLWETAGESLDKGIGEIDWEYVRENPPAWLVESDLHDRRSHLYSFDWRNECSKWFVRNATGFTKVLGLVLSGKEYTGEEPECQEFLANCKKYTANIKNILGLTIPTEDSDGVVKNGKIFKKEVSVRWLIGMFLSQLGINTSSQQRRMSLDDGGNVRSRVYSVGADEFALISRIMDHQVEQRQRFAERVRKGEKEEVFVQKPVLVPSVLKEQTQAIASVAKEKIVIGDAEAIAARVVSAVSEPLIAAREKDSDKISEAIASVAFHASEGQQVIYQGVKALVTHVTNMGRCVLELVESGQTRCCDDSELQLA